jgi:hypothetical protein
VKQGPEWDESKEKYEDFLQRIPEHMSDKLADGTAFMATPVDGFDLMAKFVASVREDDGLKSWRVLVDGMETEDEVKQAVSNIMSLEAVATQIANGLLERRNEIHVAGCEQCQKLEKRGPPMKKALNAALEAFLKAIKDADNDDDEEWKDGEADPNAWKGDTE